MSERVGWRQEMQSSKEKIEAQLCAYIDGELDDAERAEIEAHLEANPKHKALIAELRAASGMLRDLPRARVPGDLNEGLTGQLERFALLNPMDDESDQTSMRINRWPQLTAMAAVLLLAVGLGIVVYYVLPPSGAPGRGQVAVDEKALKQAAPAVDDVRKSDIDSIPSTQIADAKARNELEDQIRSIKADESKSVVKEEQGRRADMPPVLRRQNLERGGVPGDVATGREVEELKKKLGLGKVGLGEGNDGSPVSASLYLVVSTNDEAATSNQVTAYFRSNGIPHMNVPLAGLAAADKLSGVSDAAGAPSNTAYGIPDTAQPARPNFAEKPDAGAIAGSGIGGTEPRPEKSTLPAEQLKQSVAQSNAANTPARPAPDDANRGKKLTEPAASAPSAAIAKDLASDPAQKGQALDTYGKESRSFDTQWAMRRAGEKEAAPRSDDLALSRNAVIVARMNRRQANELSVALSSQQGQHAELLQRSPSQTVEGLLEKSKSGASLPALGAPVASAAPAQQEGRAKDAQAGLTVGDTPQSAPAKPEIERSSVRAQVAPTTLYTLNPDGSVTSRGALRDRASFGASRYATTQPAGGRGFTGGRAAADDQRGVERESFAAPADALHLGANLLDDPVDVVIVVKDQAPAPAAVDLNVPPAKTTEDAKR